MASIGNNGAFHLHSYNINPGLAATFPWLSGFAMSFESYEILDLKAEFVTRSAADKSGSVAMAFDYDSYDAKPANITQIYSMAGSVHGSYWTSITCRLNTGWINQMGKKYCRDALKPGDLNKYDAAKLYVGTLGDTVAVIGTLYLSYRIAFYCPQIATTNVPDPIYCTQFNMSSPITITKGGADTKLNFDETVFNGLGATVDGEGGISLPPGYYRLAVDAGYSNTTANPVETRLRVEKNGAALVPPVEILIDEDFQAGGNVDTDLSSILKIDSVSDVIRLIATAGASTGTLSMVADVSRLLLSRLA
jgi:hypothetical protein